MSRRARRLILSHLTSNLDTTTNPNNNKLKNLEQIQNPEFEKKRKEQLKKGINQIEKWIFADKALRKRNILILIHIIISILACVTVLELEWDREHGELISSPLSFYFKIGISVSTLFLIIQLTEYYYSQLYFTVALADSLRVKDFPSIDKSSKEINQSINQSDKDEIIHVSVESTSTSASTMELPTEQTPLLPINEISSSSTTLQINKKRNRIYVNMWTILRSSSLPRNYWIQVLVFLIHPIPFLHSFKAIDISSKLGLLMFLRMYYILVVYRDSSTIYRKRKVIETIPGYTHATHPEFNTFLSIKILFHRRPVMFILSCISMTTVILGYCIYILERELQPHMFTIWASIYLSFTCMFTGWPSDVYSILNPISPFTKGVCISVSVIGLFFFALLIDYVHMRMRASRFQELAVDYVQYSELELKRREEAAKLIQLVWRDYIRRSSVQTSYVHYPRIQNNFHSSNKFTIDFYKQIAINRKLRNSWKKYEISHADLLNSFFFINQPISSSSGSTTINQSSSDKGKELNKSSFNIDYEQLKQIIKECNKEMKQELLQDLLHSLNMQFTNNGNNINNNSPFISFQTPDKSQ